MTGYAARPQRADKWEVGRGLRDARRAGFTKVCGEGYATGAGGAWDLVGAGLRAPCKEVGIPLPSGVRAGRRGFATPSTGEGLIRLAESVPTGVAA